MLSRYSAMKLVFYSMLSLTLVSLISCGGSGSSDDSSDNSSNAQPSDTTIAPPENTNTAPGNNAGLRAVRATDKREDGSISSVTVYNYDDRGRVKSSVQTLYDNDNDIDGVATVNFQYDPIDRIESVDAETLFTDGSVVLGKTQFTFTSISSNNLDEILTSTSSSDGSYDIVIDFSYDLERVSTANLSGFSVVDGLLWEVNIDFSFSHNENSKQISRVDKRFNPPTPIPIDFGVKYAEIDYDNGFPYRLVEQFGDDVSREETIVKDGDNIIRTYTVIPNSFNIVTIEYEKGDCLGQDYYFERVVELTSLISGINSRQCLFEG